MNDLALIKTLKENIIKSLKEDIDKEIDKHVEEISSRLKDEAYHRIVSAVNRMKISCSQRTNNIIVEVHLDE